MIDLIFSVYMVVGCERTAIRTTTALDGFNQLERNQVVVFSNYYIWNNQRFFITSRGETYNAADIALKKTCVVRDGRLRLK